MIFMVDIVKVPLEAPCSKDKALCELSGQANGERYRFFPRLLAVDPQPVQEWGAVIALPPWTSNESIVLMNLLDWDGRCYASALPDPFTRAQALRAARLPESTRVEVFPFRDFNPLLDDFPLRV